MKTLCNATNTSRPVHITALYEDLEAGLRAKALVECVQLGMKLPGPLMLDLWRFDWLGDQSLRGIILNTTHYSGLVIISTTSSYGVHPELEKWISAWIQDNDAHASALIILLPQERELQSEREPLIESLRGAANRKRIDCFCEYFEPPMAERCQSSEKTFGFMAGSLAYRTRFDPAAHATKRFDLASEFRPNRMHKPHLNQHNYES